MGDAGGNVDGKDEDTGFPKQNLGDPDMGDLPYCPIPPLAPADKLAGCTTGEFSTLRDTTPVDVVELAVAVLSPDTFLSPTNMDP